MMGSKQAWLIAIDVDRTLLTDDYRLLPAVRSAVQHARAHGVNVILVTARGPGALQTVLDDLGDIDAAICFGGAPTLSLQDGSLSEDPSSSHHTFEAASWHHIVSEARAARVSLALYGRDLVYVEAMDSFLRFEFTHTGDRYRVAAFDTVTERPFKFLAVSDPERSERIDALAARLADRFSCARSHRNYPEIGPHGVSKGAALGAFAKARGYPADTVVAIGDSDNDLSMLAFAGHPIAMGNATGAVKAVAEWTTTTNAEAGVAVAIARCAEGVWKIPAPTAAVCI
jgi:Cof subfamily protein (haloacid dehalogenase superfamily)